MLAILKQEKERDASKTASKTPTEKKMGLKDRFKKDKDAEIPAAKAPAQVVEQPAAVAAPPAEKKPATGLTSRLAALVGGGAKAAAVSQALDSAPEHSVHATGVNPPDAAPPWTQEEQAAQAQKIASGLKAPKGTDALPAESVTAQTVAAEEAEIEADKAAKKTAKKVKGATVASPAAALPADDDLVAVLKRIADSLERIANKT